MPGAERRGLDKGLAVPAGCASCTDSHPVPRVFRYELKEDDFAIVIASDGVWEMLSSQTVADIIAEVKLKSGHVQDMVNQIVDQSSYMWKVEQGDYRDDITVIVMLLPWPPAVM